MGFRANGEAIFAARPVRPFRQAVTHQQRDWKLPARLVRNALWAKLPPIKNPAGWSFESISPDRVPAEVWTPATQTWAARERGPEVYGYYLACPFMRFELFLVRRQQQPVGCFLIGFDLGQARLADVWVLQPSAEWYEAAYRLALVASLTDRTVVEVITMASMAWRLEALKRCGFREFRRESVMVLAEQDVPVEGLDCQLVDNDIAFLTSGTPAYVT
jgi:hypothetical protein